MPMLHSVVRVRVWMQGAAGRPAVQAGQRYEVSHSGPLHAPVFVAKVRVLCAMLCGLGVRCTPPTASTLPPHSMMSQTHAGVRREFGTSCCLVVRWIRCVGCTTTLRRAHVCCKGACCLCRAAAHTAAQVLARGRYRVHPAVT